MKKLPFSSSIFLLTATLVACGSPTPSVLETADLALVLKNVPSAQLKVTNPLGEVVFNDTVVGTKTLTGLPRALYTVLGSSTPGATAPAAQSADLRAGNGTVTLEYTPVSLKASLTLTLNGPVSAPIVLTDAAGKELFSGTVKNGQVLTDLPREPLTLTAAPVEGYTAPAVQTVNLSSGASNFTLTYVAANYQSDVLKFAAGTFNSSTVKGTAVAIQLRLPAGIALPAGSSATIEGPIGWNKGQALSLPLSSARPVNWMILPTQAALAGEYTASLRIGDQLYKSQITLDPTQVQGLPTDIKVTPFSRTDVSVDVAAVPGATAYALKLIDAQHQDASPLRVSKRPDLGLTNLTIDITAPHQVVFYALNADVTSAAVTLPAQFNVSAAQAPLKFTGFRDDAFGVKGVAQLPSSHSSQFYSAFKQLSDGSFLAAGSVSVVTNGVSRNGISLARMNADGTLNSSYGSPDGVLLTYPFTLEHGQEFGSGAADLDVGTDGSVALSLNGYYLAARVLPSGLPDRSFGQDGVVKAPFYVEGTRVALLPGGGMLVTGMKYINTGEPSKMFVLKLDKTGQLDAGFGTGGIVLIDNGVNHAQARAITVDSTGNITIAGRVGGIYGFNGGLNSGDRILVLRLNAVGQKDLSFGTAGQTLLPVMGVGAVVSRMVQQQDGSLLLGGVVGNKESYYGDYLLLKFTATGQLDSRFGTNGVAQADSGDQYDEVRGLAFQADGKIVVTGAAGLARFTGAGALDTSFGVQGFVGRFGDDSAQGQDLAVTADGKIVTFSTPAVRRLLP